MRRAFLILDPSYSKIWKIFHQKIVEKTIAFTIQQLTGDKNLNNKNLLLTLKGSNDKNITKINRDYREQNKATNILSFENLTWETNLSLDQILDDNSKIYLIEEKQITKVEVPEEKMPLLDLGSMVLSLETIEREAEALKKPFDEYLAFITLHGTLHLLGFDHQEDIEALHMENKEKEIMMAISSNSLLNKL